MKRYLWLLCGVVLIVLIAVVGCIICYHFANMKPLEPLQEDAFYLRVLATLNSWILCEIMWTAVHIVLSVTPFLCTLIILHEECYNIQPRDIIILLSIASLLFMSVSYFLKPYTQAQVFRSAYEILKPAVLEYERAISTKIEASTKLLQEAIEAGEKIIGTAIQ